MFYFFIFFKNIHYCFCTILIISIVLKRAKYVLFSIFIFNFCPHSSRIQQIQVPIIQQSKKNIISGLYYK